MKKNYDRSYFDRWYRGRSPVVEPAEIGRKVAMTTSIAEYFLRRPLRNVLDIGCGEAAWRPHLEALRPGVHYQGIDPSEYAVERFGRSDRVRRGSFGELSSLGIRERFDLVVCADVLHYLDDAEIRRGLPAAVGMMRGVAFFEVVTREDKVAGDTSGLRRRPARWYAELFAAAGLRAGGSYTWLCPALQEQSSPLETA